MVILDPKSLGFESKKFRFYLGFDSKLFRFFSKSQRGEFKMRLKITQKNLTSPYDKPLDVSTIRALLVNHLNWDEFEQVRYLYNPRCPVQKARDKALKTLQKDYDKKTKRERNRDRNALDKLPFGEVIGAEVWFPKVAFTDVTKFLIDNKIPFEITSYDMTYREDLQWEIDEEKRIKHYDNVEEDYDNLYRSNDNEEEEV